MTKRSSTVLFTLFMGILVSPWATGQDPVDAPEKPKTEEKKAEELPSGASLFAKHVEAIGGEKAVRAHAHMTMKGTMDMPAAGISAPITAFASAPNKIRVKVTIPGMGETEEGYDGKVAWSMDMARGPALKTGKALEEARVNSDFYSELNYEQRYKVLETVAATEFGGAQVYKVRTVDTTGKEGFELFSKETGLRVAMISETETSMGPIKSTTTLHDYKAFGGLLHATKTVVDLGMMKQIITIKELHFDPIDSSIFDLPAAIQALVDGPAKSPGAEGAGGK